MKHQEIRETRETRAPTIHRRDILLAATAGAIGIAGLAMASSTTRDPKGHIDKKPYLDESLRLSFHTVKVGEVDVFYREVGPKNAPVILLLHGFPSASHMFRNLMPLLAPQFRLIAPDLIGFGNTTAPPRGIYEYTFENMYRAVEGLTHALGLTKYSIYAFDYGAPTGFRLAMANPEKITGIITQNGHAFLEGQGASWAAWQTYWQSPTPENREACRFSLLPESIRESQYATGSKLEIMPPDGYNLDVYYLSKPGVAEIQLDLILDNRNNVAAYPFFQNYFRRAQPPLLAVWGRFDPAFALPSAQAYQREVPHAEVCVLEAGRCVLETHAHEVADYIRDFLGRTTIARSPSNETIRIKNEIFFHSQKG